MRDRKAAGLRSSSRSHGPRGSVLRGTQRNKRRGEALPGPVYVSPFEWYLLEVYVFGDLALLFGGGAYLSLGQGGKKGQVWDAVRNLVVGQCPGLWVI